VAGTPVLAAGAKTGKEAALAEVKGAKGAQKTELVLTTKKLKKFPPDALKMPWLTKLVLDGTELELGYNRLGKNEIAKIRKTWPKATIDLGDQD
jgi:hypothetical protein